MNHPVKQRFHLQLHNGISSILFILVILSLVSFATLSLSSANADNRLTEKLLSRTTSYYSACNAAEKKLSEIDATLQKIYLSAGSQSSYFQKTGKGTSFYVTISDSQRLNIELQYLYPQKKGEPFYHILKWQVETETDKMTYNETLPLPQ